MTNLFIDRDFDMTKKENSGSESLRRPARNYNFVTSKISYEDVNQAGLKNDWFLSALSSIARHDINLLSPIIQNETNSQTGPTVGKLNFKFHQFNKLVNVECDDVITASQIVKRESPDEQWWVTLLEKGYAKFCGSYLEKFSPRIPLYHLTGGICVDVNLDTLFERTKVNNPECTEIYDLLENLTKCKDIVFNAQNLVKTEDEERKGLIEGTYSILQLKKIMRGTVRLVELRNPNGKNSSEWKGAWCDLSPLWDQVTPEEQKLNKDQDDGCFWMSWDDFARYFELLTICQLPTNWNTNNLTEIHGSFIDGKNSPQDGQIERLDKDTAFRFPFTLEKDTDLWLQVLIDMTVKDFCTVDGKNKLRLKIAIYEEKSKEKVWQTFPPEADESQFYNLNGQFYHKLPMGKYVLKVQCAKEFKNNNFEDKLDYIIKIVADGGSWFAVDCNKCGNTCYNTCGEKCKQCDSGKFEKSMEEPVILKGSTARDEIQFKKVPSQLKKRWFQWNN